MQLNLGNMAGLPAGNIHILSKSRTSFNHCFVTQDPLWPKLPSYTDSVLGKKKKNRKESQLNDLEQFIWHFIVTSGTWTINMPVYRLSPLLGGHTCPTPQVQIFEKRRNFLGPPDKMLCCNDSINSDFFLSSVTTLSLGSSF